MKQLLTCVLKPYGIVITLRVPEGRKLLFLFLIFHLAVFHLLLNNGLKKIPVNGVKALGRKETVKEKNLRDTKNFLSHSPSGQRCQNDQRMLMQ